MRAFSFVPASCLFLLPYIHNVTATLTCTKSAFVPHLPANTTILSATAVANNGSYGGGSQDKDFPVSATGLPALCAVQMHEANSSYMIGLF